jgi:hypothetical protein
VCPKKLENGQFFKKYPQNIGGLPLSFEKNRMPGQIPAT